MVEQKLSGWGNYPRVSCDVVAVDSEAELRRALHSDADGDARVPRGLGRSYADQAVSDTGLVVNCTGLDRYLGFDAMTGLLTCEAGVTLEMILRDFGPQGFLPMISPGTKFVTVGGCIANDIHGKAHHVDGCFSRCTESFRVLLASGDVVNASAEENADLYWASFGGMGLLGVIMDATIRLRRVETTFFRQTAVAVANLTELIEAFEQYSEEPYSVAWIDSLAVGANLGRGVLTFGDHAKLDDLPESQRRRPLVVSDPSPLVLPFKLPSAALNGTTIRVLNSVLEQMQRRGKAIAHYEKFFYPLDFVGSWNRGYGARGFTQYQFVIPVQNGAKHMAELLGVIARSGQSPFLNVLKRLGAERLETMLSFPMDGYTFAIDFPIRDGLEQLLHRLDDRIVEMGGRVYLGKDAFLRQAQFESMYDKLDAWRAVKAKYDPKSKFSSNLGRRLGLSS